MTITAAIVTVLLAGMPAAQNGSSAAADRTSPDQAARTARLNVDSLPIDLEKIQRALARRPAIEIPEPVFRSSTDLPLFRVRIERRAPTIEELLGPDFLRGPVSYGGMTHQEFLSMVTPKDVQGYAAFDNKQGVTVALTSLALQWALNRAIREFQEARDERAREAARKEVQEALEALRKARREAGLPDK